MLFLGEAGRGASSGAVSGCVYTCTVHCFVQLPRDKPGYEKFTESLQCGHRPTNQSFGKFERNE